MSNLLEILNHGGHRALCVSSDVGPEYAPELWMDYLGMKVVLFPGAALPTEAEFAALSSEYEAAVAASQARASVMAQIAALEAHAATIEVWGQAQPDDAGGTPEGRAAMADIMAQIAALKAQLVTP